MLNYFVIYNSQLARKDVLENVSGKMSLKKMLNI